MTYFNSFLSNSLDKPFLYNIRCLLIFDLSLQEQRMVAQKISELKLEESEHKLVIDALKEVNDPTRK